MQRELEALDRARNVERRAAKGDCAPAVRRHRVRSAAEILADPPQIPPALTDPPLFVREGISVLAAPTKVGKTNLVLNTSWALTEGKPLFGRLCVPEPVPVLLIELELSEAVLHKRLEILKRELDWSDEGSERFSAWCGRSLLLDRRGGVDRLTEIIEERSPRPELVWIDSYNAAIAGDPDKSAEARRGLQTLREVQERLGVAFGIVCEVRKAPPGQRLRFDIDDLKGSNEIAYDADSVVLLRPTDPRRTRLAVKFAASRHVVEELPDNLVLVRRGLSFQLIEEGGDVTSDAELEEILRQHFLAGGRNTRRECAGAVRKAGVRASNERINRARERVAGDREDA